jgi:hypothetical protein
MGLELKQKKLWGLKYQQLHWKGLQWKVTVDAEGSAYKSVVTDMIPVSSAALMRQGYPMVNAQPMHTSTAL